MTPAILLALALQVPAQPASPATMGELPGGQWACTPEHEAWRVADSALLKAELAKGAAAAAGDLPQLEAALVHAPPSPLGGVAVCDDRTVAFNSAAALGALVHAATRPKSTAGEPSAPFTVDPRPMPYATIALFVGSIHAGAGRYDKALPALNRGLAFAPDDPPLVSEAAYSLSKLHRNDEAVDLLAHAITVDTTASPVDLARLHRSRGYALGELGRYDEAIVEYHASQKLDPNETVAANELIYLQQRKDGRGPSATRTFTSDTTRKPGSPPV